MDALGGTLCALDEQLRTGSGVQVRCGLSVAMSSGLGSRPCATICRSDGHVDGVEKTMLLAIRWQAALQAHEPPRHLFSVPSATEVEV